MKKVFLYLYPTKEYMEDALMSKDYGTTYPFEVLNECIQKRYREKGYQVVIAQYPDKEIFGLCKAPQDKRIDTDTLYQDATIYSSNGQEKSIAKIKYPTESYLLEQITPVDELVVGGFHAMDCVKRVAEYCNQQGIDTLEDLEMTDFFFYLYDKPYFNKENYNPANYKQFVITQQLKSRRSLAEIEQNVNEMYASPIFKLDQFQPSISFEAIQKDESQVKRGRRL